LTLSKGETESLLFSHRPQDIDYPVPSEYLINVSIRDKLAPMSKMKHFKDDLLFFLFYTNCGDVMQLMAANEL
jgi:CCR4-NOT transcription complex subunit 2